MSQSAACLFRKERDIMKYKWNRIFAMILAFALLSAGEACWNTSAQAASSGLQVSRKGDAWTNQWVDVNDDVDQEPAYGYIYNLTYQSYTSTSLTLTWMSGGNNTGFHVYRKCKYDKDFQLLGTVANRQYGQLTFKDRGFVRGIEFTYRVVSYQKDETTGEEAELPSYASNTYLYKISQVKMTSAKRSGKTKAVLKWKKAAGVKGYEIYRKNSGGRYKRARRIGSKDTVKWTAGSLSGKKSTYFKVRAYVKYQGKYVYGEFSDTQTVVSLTNDRIVRKFASLQKRFPSGRYWNHKGKKKWNSATTTNRPCVHDNVMNYSTSCNYYRCPNKVIGYQCYGFAWKMSDLIYGRKAKIKNFRSYGKCRMGDVIRYRGHSVIITEKYSSYVVVGECNAGNTCIINWGRKVYKSELSGALYSRRY